MTATRTIQQETDNKLSPDDKEKKKLYIKTWGCQMNVYDSNRMADVLAPLGYEQVEDPDNADMMILNTCHIREKATEKVFSELGRMRAHKNEKQAKGGKMLMAVAGCVAQAEGDIIMQRAPYVDMVFGPQTYHQLPEMVAKATGADKNRIIHTDFEFVDKFDKLPEEHTKTGPAAFLSIQEGCDKFCTFCVVPYTRGAEFSRPMQHVLDEAQRLRDAGAVEITLLGQNVNAYHGEGQTRGLGELIARVAEIHGIERIRYTTSHPRDMDDDLIHAHRDIKELMPYIHLPIQSGSDNILKAMNRKHTGEFYLDIIERLRKACPDIALSSDFIVGFPGETNDDFEDTMKLVEAVNYASAYSFKYSQRPGTPGAAMKMQIHEKYKTERLQRLQDLLNKQQLAFNQNTVGQTMPVLFDRKGQKDNQIIGRTPYNQSLHLTHENIEKIYGKIIPVVVTDAHANSLTGKVV